MTVFGWETEEEARQHVKVFGEWQDLLKYYEDKEGDEGIEAVVIGLPLHLHAAPSVAAMKQGYHVLTEKLMAHTVAECKEMARASELYKRHCATGHQRHYNILYDHAVKMIQNGVLGDLHYIRAQWHRNNQPGADSWRQPIPWEIKQYDLVPGDLVPADLLYQRLDKIHGSLSGRLTAATNNLNAAVTGLNTVTERLANPELSPADRQRLEVDRLRFETNKIRFEGEQQLLTRQVAQAAAQIDDRVLIDGGTLHEGTYREFTYRSAEEYGYVTETMNIGDSTVPYSRSAAEELLRWRLYDRTSAGLMAELGSHQLDAANIFLAAMFDGKKQYPLSVSATATRTIFPKDLEILPVDRDVEDHIHCVYDYPAEGYDPDDELGKLRKITMAYSSINGNGFGGYGETVLGTRGSLQLDTELDGMLWRLANVHLKTRITETTVVADGERRQELMITEDAAGDPLSASIGLQATAIEAGRGYCEQIEHWAYCIRENPEADPTQEMPRCYPEVALADAVISLATNIAARLREPVPFDLAWFDVNSDATPEARYAETDEERRHFTPNLARYA